MTVTREPFDPANGLAAKLKKTAQAEGFLCSPMGDTRQARVGDHILRASPFLATKAQPQPLVESLTLGIDAILAKV